MTEENKELGQNEIMKLSNELTYRRYLMNRGQIREFFQKINTPEYIALYNIALNSDISDIYSGRTYLKELSEKMQLSIRKTSKMIGKLRDRGLVLWSHDGNGSEGTYVTITEEGRKLLEEQEQTLNEYHGRVIQKYGKENLIQLLQMMKQLETVMSTEIEQLEGEDEHDEAVE